MDISLVIISVTILFLAWALERITSRIRGLEKHMKNFRSRLQTIEKSLPSQQYQQAQQGGLFKTAVDESQLTPQTQKTASKIFCPFCKFEYDISLDRCPRCHHLNIEKIKAGRSGGGKPSPPTGNPQGTDF